MATPPGEWLHSDPMMSSAAWGSNTPPSSASFEWRPVCECLCPSSPVCPNPPKNPTPHPSLGLNEGGVPGW
ncbi:hypothetical protein JZ751_013602 [Albula glossodonta]|uniref:Uncharacterized protein n=1 Tax=Albula glossodonta TaxID=121402 RepID=A0A8T2P1B3_9TELE|nr:hypothetical protein JZ751_013602 [Albula glossodonta]